MASHLVERTASDVAVRLLAARRRLVGLTREHAQRQVFPEAVPHSFSLVSLDDGGRKLSRLQMSSSSQRSCTDSPSLARLWRRCRAIMYYTNDQSAYMYIEYLCRARIYQVLCSQTLPCTSARPVETHPLLTNLRTVSRRGGRYYVDEG